MELRYTGSCSARDRSADNLFRLDARSLDCSVLTADIARLEASIRNALAESNHDRIAKIVHQLCHDYAYAVHQPHARNGGLIGLAAAAIALGSVRVHTSVT